MYCKLNTRSLLGIELQSTDGLTPSTAEWSALANGQAWRTKLLVNEGLANVQLRKVQNTYAVIERITLRLPVGPGVALVAHYRHAKGWRSRLKQCATAAPVVFNACEALPVPALSAEEHVQKVWDIVGRVFNTPGQFLDWLAYRSPLEIELQTIHGLTPEQAEAVLRYFVLVAKR